MNKIGFAVSGIDWDLTTDDDSPLPTNLPTEVEVWLDDVDLNDLSMNGLQVSSDSLLERILDEVTDKYGWCINSCTVMVISETKGERTMTSDTQTEKAVLAALIASFTGSQSDKSNAALDALTYIYRDKNGEVSRDELREKAVAIASAIGCPEDADALVNSVLDNALKTARMLLDELVAQIDDDLPSDEMTRHFKDALNDAKQFLGIEVNDDDDDDDDDGDDDNEGENQ